MPFLRFTYAQFVVTVLLLLVVIIAAAAAAAAAAAVVVVIVVSQSVSQSAQRFRNAVYSSVRYNNNVLVVP